MMNATTNRQEWRDVVKRVCHGDHRVIVERSGIPVSAIVSDTDLNRLLEIASDLSPGSRGRQTADRR